MTTAFEAALNVLQSKDIEEKTVLAKGLEKRWLENTLSLQDIALPDIVEAGRPEKPELVAPRDLPRRRLGSKEGVAAMLHAVAHIEFNAINLAVDAVYRFKGMPEAYYSDWIKVAAEEAYHFSLVRERLVELGYDYGDFPAHNGLWDLAVDTRHDLRLRMALVPRVMEARGLDVTPGMMKKFKGVGENRAVDILSIILRDEISHVKAGTKWFNYLCEKSGDNPEKAYFEMVEVHFPAGINCPLNQEARLKAGFSQNELDTIQALCDEKRQKRG